MPPSLIFSCSPNRDMNIHANFPKAPACWRQTYSFPSEQSSLYQTLRFFWPCQEESQETLSLSLSDSDFLIFPYSFSNVEVRSNENSSRQGKCCRHSGGSVHPPVADLRAIFTHTIRPTFRTSHHITKMWKVVNPQLQSIIFCNHNWSIYQPGPVLASVIFKTLGATNISKPFCPKSTWTEHNELGFNPKVAQNSGGGEKFYINRIQKLQVTMLCFLRLN